MHEICDVLELEGEQRYRLGDLYVEKKPGVRRYSLVFEELRADALGHDESVGLIRRMADSFG